MAVIDMPVSVDSKIRKSINLLIEDSLDQTRLLEELIEEAPSVLSGYINFRKILRAHKRGLSLIDSIEKYSMECCPPKLCPSEDCSTCNECWLNFTRNYFESITNCK